MTWELTALAVFLGAFAQSATGVGFAVVAGPFLLQAFGYERALGETAAFSLLTALVCAAPLARKADRPATLALVATLPVGAAVGAGVLAVAPRLWVLGAFGVLLLAFGIGVVRRSLFPLARPAQGGRGIIAAAGVAGGVGAYLFAAPGPAAAWGLARSPLEPTAVRATLAVYFIVAYAALLAVLGLTGRLSQVDAGALAAFSPVCLAGALAGLVVGRRLSDRGLRLALGALVTASGLSLLFNLFGTPS